MTVYVDPLGDYGWRLRGRRTQNCHLFTDSVDLTALHAVALRVGMKREWFQDHPKAPHYDLTPSRRALALKAGAVEATRAAAVTIWRARRAALGLRSLGEQR